MIDRLHIGRPATARRRARSLRLATVLAAAVALTPSAIADARLPSRIDEGGSAPADWAERHAQAARMGSTVGVAAYHASAGRPQLQRPGPTGPIAVGSQAASALDSCPCNAGLPVGTGKVVDVQADLPQSRRQGPTGPIARPRTAPQPVSSEASGSDGFDWSDAGTGAAAVALLGTLVLATGRVRSRPLAG